MPISFAPIIDEKTELLIIGTMPGIASLKAREYYAYKYNVFWQIISEISAVSNFKDYHHKIEVLKKRHIGLWDNLQYCERIGSLDSKIKNETPNDFEKLLHDYPKIQKLLFNGQKSYQLF